MPKNKALVFGVNQILGYGLPYCIKMDNVTIRDDTRASRGTVKASALTGYSECLNVLADFFLTLNLFVFFPQPVTYLFGYNSRGRYQAIPWLRLFWKTSYVFHQ